MLIETIAIDAANSIVGELIKWGYKKIIKSELSGYEKELSKIIQQSIDEYAKVYPIIETDKIPFYTSLLLLEEFIKFRFTNQYNKDEILKALKADDRIIPPTEQQLLQFFTIFNSKVELSDRIKKLNIESNYKEEIFRLSETLIEAKDIFLKSINDIKIHLNSLSISSSLTEEWFKQLDEILENLKTFKPYTAEDRLRKLEQRIKDAGRSEDKKIFSRIYFMQSQCLDQMQGSDISDKQAALLIQAYKSNMGNADYKANAALSYYVLGDHETAKHIGDRLLLENEFNVVGWLIKCFLKAENFIIVLIETPKIVKEQTSFKIHLYRWLRHNKYINTVKEFEDLNLKFDVNISEKPVVNYLNRNYALLKASYLLTKYYETQKLSSIAIYFPSAKLNPEFIYANQILKEVIHAIKGSEIEKNNHYYAFHYYCSCLVLDDDINHVYQMEQEFEQLGNKSIDVVLRMAQAYNNLSDDEATKKATQVLERYDGEPVEIIYLLNTINYSILKNKEKAEEFFIKYLDIHSVIDRNCLLNVISLIRRGGFGLNNNLKQKLENIIQLQKFSNQSIKVIFQIAIYISFNIGFHSKEDFHNHLKLSEEVTDLNDDELYIHIAYGYVDLSKWTEALHYLKSKINYEVPSETFKLYCKILFKIEGHKPELLSHLRKWRMEFFIDYELSEMELYFATLQKNWKEVIKIAKAGIDAYPDSEIFIYYLFSGMLEDIDVGGIVANSKLVENKDFQNEDYGIVVSMALLKAGLSEQSLSLLYSQAIKKENTKTRQSYITLSIQFPSELLIDYDLVQPGTFVKYIINNKKNVIQVKEENKNDFPQKLLVGKKVGESFGFQKPMSSVLESGIIMRCCNKYLALFEEILIDAENPLSGLSIQVMQFEGNSIEAMNKTFINNFGVEGTMEKERVEEEFNKYYSGIISFSDIAIRVFRKDFINAYFNLSNKDGKLFKAISPAVSNIRIEESSKIVLDFTSVCLFFELSNELNVKFNQTFIISGLLKAEVIQKLEEERTFPKTEFSLSITKDSVKPHFYPIDFKEKRINHFQLLLHWIDENCKVESVPERFNFIMGLKEEHKRDNLIQVLFENKLLSDKEDYLLLTNDIFYYRTFHCPTHSVVSPMHYLNKYNQDKGQEITQFLLSHNYVGIYITAQILSDEAFKMLAGKENKFPICLENLRYNWNPYNAHVGEAIKFFKTLYLSAFLNDAVRQQIVVTVFSNVLVGLPSGLVKLIPSLVTREFKLLPQQSMEILQILGQTIQIRFSN